MGMITDYKYIYFTKIEDKPKTSVWQCRSKRNGGLLGIVRWYGPWRQYAFLPAPDTIFNISCNEAINNFIRQLAQERLI